MKKIVLKLELRDGDERGKQKVMTTASGLSGVDSVAMDMKDKKLTITGDIDPVKVVGKLRKICQTEILTVGPAKPEENNKKKDDGGGGGGGGGAKKDDKQQQSKDDKKSTTFLPPHPHPHPQYYYQNYPPPNFQQHQPSYMNMMMMNQSYPNNYNRYPYEDHQDPNNSCVIS